LSDAAGPGAGPVLVDTDVFSKVYVPASRDDVGRAWVAALAGRTVVISVQTAVELRVWPRLRNWGRATNRRSARADRLGAHNSGE